MRMRPKKNRVPRMEKVDFLFAERAENGETDIKESFGNENGLYLEIGCGKGAFINGLAEKEKGNNLLAVELVRDVLMMAMEKTLREGHTDIRFINADAGCIDALVPPGSVKKLFLNFSDPWPKKRNAKRRLTSPLFLEKYKKILAADGKIFFKTDNKALFDYSLDSFSRGGYALTDVCFDLHSDPLLSEKNIETEYEKNFSAKGFLINSLIASPKRDSQTPPDARQKDI